jgi:nucleoid-associated protein YgaU
MTVETNQNTRLYDLFKAFVTLALIIVVVVLALQMQDASQAGEPVAEGPSEELAAGEPESEETVSEPETEETVGESGAEATPSEPEAEETVSESGAGAIPTEPDEEATASEPETEATPSEPESEGTVGEPEVTSEPEAEATPSELGAGEETTASSEAPPGQLYVVQRGDWLKKIAEQFWGDEELYILIVEATNAKAAEDSTFSVITNPNRIYPEQKLWIPDR